MGEPTPPEPVMLVVAAFSKAPALRDWSKQVLEIEFGPVMRESAAFAFEETDYYESEMGTGLEKQIFSFSRLIAPDAIVRAKILTNRMEQAIANPAVYSSCDFHLPHPIEPSADPVKRPLNLDPGYLTAGTLVLASTKAQPHRIYLTQGIYAELTLKFEFGEFSAHPWTYPNYARSDYREFLREVRADYLRLIKQLRGVKP